MDPQKNLSRPEFAAELFGIYLNDEMREVYLKKTELSRKKNVIPMFPKLSENEVLNLYNTVRETDGQVTLANLQREVGTHVSDILATVETSFFPGETATIAYKIPKKYVQELQGKPFISCVLSDIKYTPASGGGWTLRGQNIGELSKIKVPLPSWPRQTHGLVTMQIPFPQDPTERYEFRLFASTNGHSYGKQIGKAVSFTIAGPRPGRPVASDMHPTRCMLSWTPVEAAYEGSFGKVDEYVVRCTPDLNSIEETAGSGMSHRWNHLKGIAEPVCVHEIENLVPGVSYKFSVMPRHKKVRHGVAAIEHEHGGGHAESGVNDGNRSIQSMSYFAPKHLPPTAPGQPKCLEFSPKETRFVFTVPRIEHHGKVWNYHGYYLVGNRDHLREVSRRDQHSAVGVGSRKEWKMEGQVGEWKKFHFKYRLKETIVYEDAN